MPMGIFSNKMGSWNLASSLIITSLYIIAIYFIINENLLQGERETKYLKVFLGSLFRQPVTSHRFWFV
jgi:hypothetical protein